MVEKLKAELPWVLAYLRWRHRMRTINLAEDFFRHLCRYLGRFPRLRRPGADRTGPRLFNLGFRAGARLRNST